MKKLAKQLRFCAAMCAVCFMANATTVIPPTFEEMVDRADLVFVGKVIESRSEWRTSGTNRAILSFVSFEKSEVLKGVATPSVTLQFLGGTVGDVSLKVAGVPQFSLGERVILFVEKNGIQFCPIVGVFHGKFGLRKDEKSGREIVVMHDGKPLRDVSEIGTGEGAEFRPSHATIPIPTDRQPMAIDDFKAHIRTRTTKEETK